MEPDIQVENNGSIFLFRPLTEAGEHWLRENVQEDAQWFGGALAVEHGYARELAAGASGDGLKLV